MNRANLGIKLFILAVIAILIISVGMAYVGRVNQKPMSVSIPVPEMPSPNAHDYYVRAAKMFSIDVNLADDELPVGAREEVLKKNANALSLFRQGMNYKYMHPPIRGLGSGTSWSDLSSWPWLLCFEGRTKEMKGDLGGAMQCYLDAVELGEDAPRGANIMGAMQGMHYGNIGRHFVWQIAEKLNASQARAAAKRLEDIMSKHVPFADIVEQDKWSNLSELIDALRTPHWRDYVYQLHSSKGSDKRKAEVKMVLMGKNRILQNCISYADECITNAEKPYGKVRICPPNPAFPMDGDIASLYDRVRFDYIRKVETQNALLLVTLALSTYKLEHKQYPASLSELVPGYIQAVPADPFDNGKPVKYKRSESSYVAYSLGPDMTDDGGKIIVDPAIKLGPKPNASEFERRHYVTQSSKGDIVAGINR